MKKLVYITVIFAFVLAFTSCEKEVIEPFAQENRNSETRGQNLNLGSDVSSDGSQPCVDEDLGGDLVTDPDDDEDFDEDEEDGVTDPDDDEDFDEDEDIGK